MLRQLCSESAPMYLLEAQLKAQLGAKFPAGVRVRLGQARVTRLAGFTPRFRLLLHQLLRRLLRRRFGRFLPFCQEIFAD
jgi:hypothetical protein